MRLYTYLAAGTAGFALVAAAAVGCDDRTVVSLPALDADVDIDATIVTDANKDDANKTDGAVVVDAQTDAPVPPDASADSSRDGAVDGGDGGGVGISKAELLDQLGTEVCTREKSCCQGKPFVDLAICKTYFPEGYYGSFPGLLNNLLNAKIVVNQAKAAACLAQAKINECETTGRSAANEKAFRLTCAQAIEGTVAAGGACNYDIECVTGFNCSSEIGLAGTCVANGSNGAACKYVYSNKGYVLRDTCSANASGDTGLRCDSATNTCKPAFSDGVACQGIPANCASGACNPGTGTCGQQLLAPLFCNDFAP
jgi:hypothetical protein